ncbi:MAG: DNA mismatch repair endonuclease MutL [Selenomonadaceae bacterium]|nr:DNA mismatch repair endonuclease MutL [Selenomonadaceae bacterium]
MSIVHLLDDDTVNKIAAGEVVERPASVVKELIENAVDAGATVIETEVMAGGTSLMRVTDNGCGMNREDAELAVKRHATSKIENGEDILTVPTLGFRGEALPTIAAVSRFSMVTRRKEDELGVSVRIIGGKKPEISEAGASPGTTVKVEDLFFNTPARKKFMKTTHTEGMKVNDCVVKAALAEPGVSFRLINNNKVSVKTPGTGSLRDAIIAIYGGAVGESLLPLSFKDEDVKITGFLTKPSMLRSSRAWQTFIVNGRVVENKAMARAVDNAYHSLLPKAGYPLAVLVVEVPARSVDVNVHPRKAEIKFEDEGRIFKAVYKAVVDAVRPEGQSLEQVAAVARVPERRDGVPAPSFSVASFAPSAEQETSALPRPFVPTVPFADRKGTANFAEVQKELMAEKNSASRVSYEQQQLEPLVADAPETKDDAPLAMVPIGQVALCFIIAQDGDTLYIIDQHAAHERVLYDRFSALADDMPSQQLLVHLLLDFSTQESELLERQQELLSKLGFDLAKSGENQFRLCSVPADIPMDMAETTLRKILGWLMEMHAPTAAEIRHACLAMTACKAAIKRGDELNLRQMQLLLEALSETARPYTCPHGRPTILRFTGTELAKMFKRT